MPTNYTAMIDEDPNLSTAKWVTEGLARSFGACSGLKEHDQDLTEDEIEEYLKNEVARGAEYHLEQLLEAQDILKKLIDNPEKAWDELYNAAVDKKAKSNAQNMEETKTRRLRHQQIKQDLIKLRDNTKDEVTRNIAELGLSQLEVVKSETEPYISTIPGLEEFKSIKLASLEWNVRYHTENVEKVENREREKLLIYQKIKSEVKEILG